MSAAKEWWCFRQHSTYFGYGTEETAMRYLRFLNQNRAVNHYQIDRIQDVFPTPSTADLEKSPDRIDMEKEMTNQRT